MYLAEDQHAGDARVALKFLLPHFANNPRILERFLREMELSITLAHPNIVRVERLLQDYDAPPCMVMEFIEGESLKRRMGQSGEMPIEQILVLLLEVADEMRYAHEQQVIHRDLKPDNILLSTENSAKVSDFGIARLVDHDDRLTRTGETIGTPYYMSPEQCLGDACGPRSDIYSLGIIAFEMATGKVPFVGASFQEITAGHILKKLPNIQRLRAGLPARFVDFVELATQKEAKHRYQDMSEVLSDLQRPTNRPNCLARHRFASVLGPVLGPLSRRLRPNKNELP